MTALSVERVGRITGSRVSAVLGLSPYQTRADVLRDMVRQSFGAESEFTGNIATRYGEEHEIDGIHEYESIYGVEVTGRQQFVHHPYVDWLGVTIDGAVPDYGLIEVKAPFRATYTHASERPDYVAQMQLQMACTDSYWCDLVVWRPDGISVSRVQVDPWWLESVQPVLEVFMAEYNRIIAGPELAEPYLTDLQEQRDDDDWAEAALDYLEACMALEAAQTVKDAAKDKLVDLHRLSPDLPAKGAGVTLIQNRPRKSVAYKDALVALAPSADLTPFTKEQGDVSWSVRRTGAA